MLPRPLTTLLVALATSFATGACAQPAPAPAAQASTAPPAATPVPAPPPLTPSIAPVEDALLPRVRSALEAAERGRFTAAQYADLADHPLYGWIEYASLRRDFDRVSAAQAQLFLSRYDGQAVARTFRAGWLAAAARREDWAGFDSVWRADIDNLALRCHALNARQTIDGVDAQWIGEVQSIWLSSGRSLPDACDGPFAVFAEHDGLTPELLWQRIELAAAQWQPGVMRSAARGLPAQEQALANDYAAFLDSVHPRALDWPKTPRSRLVASHGLAKLGKDDPDAAEARLPQYAQALEFSEADRGRVLYQIALWSVASYLPDSERRLNLVPEASFDERLHEWHVREAMSRSDWPAALAAIGKMPADQRADSRWTWFEARLAELTGDTAAAQRLYRTAARVPEFHGFLAADRLGQPYPLCPWLPEDSAVAESAVAGDPAIARAIRLHRLDRHGWAVAEWHEAMDRFDDTQRRIAVEVAQANDWFDRAVFSLGRNPAGDPQPEELRLYGLRFPLHHAATIRREAAKYDIDPAWVAAEIRAESIFNPQARSPADARGLMQVLPGTGAAVARRIGVPWRGGESLYDADTNIVLGTAYLRQLLDEYGGQPYFAIAGYNAGPTPLNRWRSQRPGMDPDFWIETISYRETREYVARILAFSVIYDWRLNGDALTLEDRMRGRIDGPRKGFACPAPAPVAAASGG
ncbi:lytic transglycosylase domain-containing protein [Lysobacter sp. D1-1-M9]|uniref:lytic transglycosylase domain-containing protein n=1 Tax=Novilysobacter longmucuonensis TaxID=3098603 RepID=UPI003983002A